MSHTDHRTLIDHGRKSGLTTAELYSALTGRSPLTNDFVNGSADSNGFEPSRDQQGHPVYRPRPAPESR